MAARSSLLQEIGPVYSSRRITHQEFERHASANPELILELEADGKIKVMSPVSPESGNRENQINADLVLYERGHPGKSFSSSTGFTLPDGSVRSPDGSYVSAEQLGKFSKEDLQHFAAIVPEFVFEVLSPSDNLKDAENKMRDTWIANGVKLAWLVDVDGDKLWIYRADHSVELVTPLDRTVDGEDVLPGFTFDLTLLA